MPGDDPAPLSGLQHLVFCPRQAALIHLEGAWSENLHTAQGGIIHQEVHTESGRIKGGVLETRGLWLCSDRLDLVGRADVVEFHPVEKGGCRLPGRTGLWRPFPVEYKKGSKRPEPGSLVQLCAQALCLEEMLEVEVAEGAIYFGKSKRRLTVVFDTELRERTAETAAEFHRIMRERVTPPPRKPGKCNDCSLEDLCQPKAGRNPKPVRDYLASALAASLAGKEPEA